MDRIEVARQIASDLHAQAVAKGKDPLRPYAFAVAEAMRREIDVEKTTPGAAMLNGGRASFSPKNALILHESVGTPFEQAFLVAHEIGHVELGDDPDAESVQNIDPARSSEPSPVGIDRVVDYSPRQRREVQMDLFAREFLLPRPVVRKLHVEEGLTASQIAEKFGAPFEVVAQQLLDALLLPSVTLHSEAERIEHPLNSLQAHAANHRGRAYLLEAGPGTGKTQTLTARVEGLLADGIDPRRILLLTFSNKAAGEMEGRIALKDKDAACAMWIGTFHAFGLDLIRRFCVELDLPKNPRLLDRTDAVEILLEEFPRLNLKHYRNLYDPTQNITDILTAISRAKDEVIDVQKYTELAEAMLRKAATPEEKVAAEKAIEVAQVYQEYETLKRQAGCIDFGDLVLLPALLLEGDIAIRDHLRRQYDHVLVDEYQDVNRSSVRLLQALCGDGKNLWVVGDAKQSIYRFRGASSFNMVRFGTEDFLGGERGRLKQNYRSVEEVTHVFSAFATGMTVGDRDSALDAERGFGSHQPELFTVNRVHHQTVALADKIEAMRSQGNCYRDQAVLCTGNEKLSNLAQDLERLGVPVLFLGSLFERPEVKDAFAFLSVLIDRRATGLVRIACWPEFAMSMNDVATVIDHLRHNEGAADGGLCELAAIPNLTEAGCTALMAIARILDGFDECSSPWIVLATMLLERTRTAAQIAISDNIGDRSRGIALWQLMNFIRTQPSGQGLPITRLLNRVRRLVRLADDRELRLLPFAAQGLDAVRLMTIHGAKGLEFAVVHLPGLNAGTLPRTPPPPSCPPPDGMIQGSEGSALEVFRAEQAQEQECLFYVALSRARDRLFLYAPTQKSNGNQWGLSPFLDRLGQGLNRRHVTPDGVLPEVPEDRKIELVIEGGLRFSASQIGLYEACARRFFYTHVLQLGGRRGETAFMQMHEVVRTVTQTLIAEGVATDDNIDLEERIWEAMITHELTDHGSIEELKTFATELIQYFVETRAGYTSESPTTLSLALGDEEITVKVDDVLVGQDGKLTLRRVRTGHMRSTESDDVGAAAFVLAAQQDFPDARVEVLSLSNQKVQNISLSKTKLQTRQKKLVDDFSSPILEPFVKADLPSPLTDNLSDTSHLIEPLNVIHTMIDLRAQVAELDLQIQALQPTFGAACLALNTEKISLERAIISRRLTPGRWAYSNDVVVQEDLFKLLKKQFQQAHEPIAGREVAWTIKLILPPV
jgi:superfamily I DNA/RNA helicase